MYSASHLCFHELAFDRLTDDLLIERLSMTFTANGKIEGNVPPLLHDRFAKGEAKKDGDSVGLCKNVWCDKCTIIPSDEGLSHAKVCKRGSASVLNGNM